MSRVKGVDPETVRESYLKQFHAHAAAIEQACANLGIKFYQVSTARPLELMLFDFLSTRGQRRSARAERRAANPAATGGAP